MKKLVSLLLALLMLVPLTGCFGCFGFRPKPSDLIRTPAPTSGASAAPTDIPEQTQAAAPTEYSEGASEEANAAFRELDLEIFRVMVCSSADNYHQYIVSDPARFGIDPDDVGPAGWGELTYEEHLNTVEFFRGVLEELEGIDRSLLNDLNRVGYDAIKRACEKQIAFEDYYYYDEPLEPINGIQTMIPLSMALFEIRSLEDVETYVTLVEDIPRYIGQIGDFEREKAERGLFMCETALDQVIDTLDNVTNKGEESILITAFEDEALKKAQELGMTREECTAFSERNRKAVLEGVLPAYSQLRATVSGLRSKCRAFEGAYAHSADMLEYYKLRLKYEGATDEDVGIIKELLLNMGDDLYSDIYRAVNMGSSDILDRYEDPVTFGSVEANVEWLMGLIGEYYPDLPEYELEYRPVPSDLADDFSPAAYLVPAFDDCYHNVILVNPKSENSDDLFTIAHETIPGHLFQYVFARNTDGLSLTQQLLEPTGYAEAWTVFTEYFVARHCDEKDKWLCMLKNSDDTFCNVFLPAYVSILVNAEGCDLAGVRRFLKSYGMESAAEIFYEYAVTMPYLTASYAVGFAYLFGVYNASAPFTPDQHRSFFERYLSFGPCDMDVIREYMR